MNPDVAELERALKKVDTICDLVKELCSSDVEVQQRASEEADHYLAALEDQEQHWNTHINTTSINTTSINTTSINTTSINTTSINTTSINHKPAQPGSQTSIQDSSGCPEGFLKVMEEDAEERSRRRKVKEVKAHAFKQRGNEAFMLGDFDTAVQHYSSGLEELRDMQPLYTNRAQAYIKLRRFKQAIEDCEWALKCDERCVKALLHMGRAHLALQDYNQARRCFQRILEVDPSRAAMVQECLLQVEQQEQREVQERRAREEMERGEDQARAVSQLLEKLSRPDQIPLYYSGALHLLAQVITDCSTQTVFRLNNGFSVVSSILAVNRCMSQLSTDPGSQELCAAVLQLWRVVCEGNDENQTWLLTCSSSSLFIELSLASHNQEVVGGCLGLLCSLSRTQKGRYLTMDRLNLHRLTEGLMGCVSKQQESGDALTVLRNFASENKYVAVS